MATKLVKSIFGAAKKGYGMLGKGKTVVKDTNPPMIKIKPKPKGTTPKNLDNQKKIKVSSKPAILGKETYNYEGLKEVKGSKSMKEKSKPIKLPPRKGSPKKDYATLSDIKKDNPTLYKKYMENLGKKTSKPSSFVERRMTLKPSMNTINNSQKERRKFAVKAGKAMQKAEKKDFEKMKETPGFFTTKSRSRVRKAIKSMLRKKKD